MGMRQFKLQPVTSVTLNAGAWRSGQVARWTKSETIFTIIANAFQVKGFYFIILKLVVLFILYTYEVCQVVIHNHMLLLLKQYAYFLKAG